MRRARLSIALPVPARGGAPQALSHGAVDVFDVAARLEASGLSDAQVRRHHGAPDVFGLASRLVRSAPPVPGGRVHGPSGLDESVRRALLLVAGAVLAAGLVAALGVGAVEVQTAGALGWVGGQAVAAIAWTRAGAGQLESGLRRGATATAVLLVVAAALGAGVAALEPGGWPVAGAAVLCATWVGYAAAVSLLVVARASRAALLVLVAGVVLLGVASAAGGAQAPALVLVAALGSALGVGAIAVRRLARAGGLEPPDASDWHAAAPAALQALLLAASLLGLLSLVPAPEAAGLVVAGVAGAVVADPAIVLLRSRMRRSASRLHVVSAAARRARHAAIGTALATAATAAVVAALAVVSRPGAQPGWTVDAAVTAAFTGATTAAAALNAFGAPWRAVLVSALVAVATGVALVQGLDAFAVAVVPALLGAVALVAHRVSDPRVAA